MGTPGRFSHDESRRGRRSTVDSGTNLYRGRTKLGWPRKPYSTTPGGTSSEPGARSETWGNQTFHRRTATPDTSRHRPTPS